MVLQQQNQQQPPMLEPHPGGVWRARDREQAEEHLRPGGARDGILELTAEAIRHLRRAAVWIPVDELHLKCSPSLQNRVCHCCYDGPVLLYRLQFISVGLVCGFVCRMVVRWCVWTYLQISIWTWPVIRLRICGLVLRFIHMILGYYYQLLPCLYRIDLLCSLAMLVAWSCVAVLCG
jgi:hypothetical protein